MHTVCKRQTLWRCSPARACDEHDRLHENVESRCVNKAADGWEEVEEEEEERACDEMHPIDTNANWPPFSHVVLSDRCVHVW